MLADLLFIQEDIYITYFLDKIHKRFINTNNLIIAVSVGLPYVETLIKSDKLNIISYIFLRTTFDLNLFKKYFFEDRIFYLPDISLVLNQTSQITHITNIITPKIIENENTEINHYIEILSLMKKNLINSIKMKSIILTMLFMPDQMIIGMKIDSKS